ncbi:flagellar basal body rod protein FlgC [Jatrophihabitans sp.]|uniref:flagellar basal body rod protein FlgC n=1 Tax=Jatrophihabitans sp. TaxID=1932789 RepID=UPI002BD6B3E1|nr:flagellar basal body rod C-terminal domain-containing protein [Jatrophihabitans sp.]
MSIFSAITTSGTGLSTFRTWIDVIANNMANINTVKPTSGAAFQAQYVQAEDIAAGAPDQAGGGVRVTALPLSSAEGRLTYQPSNPLADARGYVRLPDIDMAEQMGNLIMAQRAFQANAAVVDRARETYLDAINIGKNH